MTLGVGAAASNGQGMSTPGGTAINVPSRGVVLVAIEAHIEPGDIRSAPVGTITDSGDEIILEEGGANVWLEIRVGDWDPDDTGVKLLAWDAALDSSGFSSGMEGVLTFKSQQCESDADCEAALGPGTSGVGPPFLCFLPLGAPNPTHCTPGFLDTSRADYITPGLVNLVDPRRSYFGGADLAGKDDPEPFPPQGFYAGTIVLEVPPNAKGTFAIGLKSVQFVDQNMEVMPFAPTGSVKITVRENVVSMVSRVGYIATPLLLFVVAMVYFGRRRARAEQA